MTTSAMEYSSFPGTIASSANTVSAAPSPQLPFTNPSVNNAGHEQVKRILNSAVLLLHG